MWKVFNTLPLAQAYADAGAAQLPRQDSDATKIWAVPMALIDGRYVVVAWDDGGTVWQADWAIPGGNLPW